MIEQQEGNLSNENTANQDAILLVASYPRVALTVDCVIFGFDENCLKVLVIKSDLLTYGNQFTLLGDKVHANEDLDAAAHRVLLERTGLQQVYLEQVHTFSAPNRHPGGRVVTTVYASLLNIKDHELKIKENELNWQPIQSISSMAFDHKVILDTCYIWLKKRIQEHPLAFNLLPEKFSLRQLQNVYESILNQKLDRRNFRKKFANMGFLIDLAEMEVNVTHRPGKLYGFDYAQYALKKKQAVGIDF